MNKLLVIGFLIIPLAKSDFTDLEYLRLPKLFHLDEYDKCLTEKEGIYCVGKFQIYSDINFNPDYDLILEYSKNLKHYNRTFVHRGYCVNKRCPSKDHNTSRRFEKCVDAEMQALSLRARVYKVEYCQTYDDVHTAKPIDLPKLVFLTISAIILPLNFIGTVYDVWTRNDKVNEHSFLNIWSIPDNWRKVTSTHVTPDPRFRNLQYMDGLRVLILIFITVFHSSLAANKTYQLEPRHNEEHLGGFITTYTAALSTFSQVFVLFSSFLSTYNILIMVDKINVTFKMLPVFILKRYLRLLPIYILGIGFSATWWPSLGNGPLWPLLVGKESDVCRRNFWYSFFFVSNIFNPCEICLLSTWIMVVDMQLHLLVLFLVMCLLKLRNMDLSFRILYILYAASVVITFSTVYIFKFKPLIAVTTPEILMTVLSSTRHFTHFYIQAYNGLIMAVTGIILGHMQYITVKRNVKLEDYKWVMRLQPFGYTSLIFWPSSAIVFKRYMADDLYSAFYMTLDRVIVSSCLLFCLYTSGNVKGNIQDFLSWKGWKPLARISFCLTMIHWQINHYIIGISRNLFESGLLNSIMNGVATVLLSIAISLPLCILIEYPLEKCSNQLFRKLMPSKPAAKPVDKQK